MALAVSVFVVTSLLPAEPLEVEDIETRQLRSLNRPKLETASLADTLTVGVRLKLGDTGVMDVKVKVGAVVSMTIER